MLQELHGPPIRAGCLIGDFLEAPRLPLSNTQAELNLSYAKIVQMNSASAFVSRIGPRAGLTSRAAGNAESAQRASMSLICSLPSPCALLLSTTPTLSPSLAFLLSWPIGCARPRRRRNGEYPNSWSEKSPEAHILIPSPTLQVETN